MPIYKMQGKKDGLQKYRVRINYTDRSGKAHQLDRVAYGSDAAKELERQLSAEYSGKVPASNTSITIYNLYDSYIKVKKNEIRETSLNRVEKILSNHVLPTLKDIKVSKLNTEMLQNWKNHIEQKGLGIVTKKNIYSYFSAMLNFAVKMEYLPSNPLTKIGNFKDAYIKKENIDYYTADEFKKFISAAKEEAQRLDFNEWNYYVFFNIAFYTGARKGEIHALKWSDIEDSTLHIRRSIAQKLKGGDRETPPKNISSIRDLQLPKALISILNEHKKRCKENIKNFSDDFRICGGEICLRDTSLSKRNIKYSKLAGIKTIRIHDFRHTHASLLANEGINIQEIARRLGHSKIEITWNIYSHLYPREEERAVAILDSI